MPKRKKAVIVTSLLNENNLIKIVYMRFAHLSGLINQLILLGMNNFHLQWTLYHLVPHRVRVESRKAFFWWLILYQPLPKSSLKGHLTPVSQLKKVTENLGPEGIFSDTLKNTTISNLEQSHTLPALKYWFKISMGTSWHGYTQEVKRVPSISMTWYMHR